MTQQVFKKKLPIALVILDGFGVAQESPHNAIVQAHTPTFNYLFRHYPHTHLDASGSAVGLMPGIMGNSEVGHLTIGAGAIIEQDVVRIHNAINDGSFFSNSIMQALFKKLCESNHALHIMGLLSDGNVHSSIEHLFAYIKTAHDCQVPRIFVHAFLDGRDTPPQSAHTYLERVEIFLKDFPRCTLSSMTGRSYAMDRNKQWQKTEQTYRMLTTASSAKKSWHDVLTHSYDRHVFDEFVAPTQLDPAATILDDDAIIFFNFRADRAQQLTQAFIAPDFNGFERQPPALGAFLTPVDYASTACPSTVLFARPKMPTSLKEWLNDQKYRIFTCAEQEKYAHVTYFFNGGIEKKFEHERMVIIPSASPTSFAQYPEMAAAAITEAALNDLQEQRSDVYLINYANADMVGHTGDLAATIKAIEFLDQQIAQLYKALMAKNGTLLITADHGNAEEMFDEKNQQPKTAHTANPVPFIIAQRDLFDMQQRIALQGLADIAPFIKRMMQEKIIEPNTRNPQSHRAGSLHENQDDYTAFALNDSSCA